MIIHLINDSDVTRGGAQKIVNEVSKLPTSIVLDKNSLSDLWIAKLFLKYRWLIDILILTSRYKNPHIVIHSRCFFALMPFFYFRSVKCTFYCHAQYRRFRKVFNVLKFDRYICVSNSTKEYLSESGVDEQLIDIVSNPILSIDSSNVTYTNSTDMKSYEFAFIGSLEEWKGILHLIDILEKYGRIQKRFITLHIIGKGSLQPSITKIMGELKYVDINLLGYQENPFSVIQHIPIIIVPSLEEGFGLVAVESRYHNKIVLYNDIPALKEVCQGDELCLAFDIGNYRSFSEVVNSSVLLINKLGDRQSCLERQSKINKDFGSSTFLNKLSHILNK